MARRQFPTREAWRLPVRINSFPNDAEEKALGETELPLHICTIRAESVALLGGWSVLSRICL